MKHLIRLITLRHLLKDRWHTLLLFLGIALGIAVYVSVNIAVGTAVAAFRATVDAVAGKTQIQITGQTTALDEDLFLKVKGLPFVDAAAPVVETIAQIDLKPRESLILLGIDIFSDKSFRRYRFKTRDQKISDLIDFLTNPHAIVVSEELVRKYRLRAGDNLPLTIGSQRIVFKINSILAIKGPAQALEGSFAIIDIAAAQELLDKVGHLDRIDIILKEGMPVHKAIQRLQTILPSGVNVERPESRGVQVEKMVGSYTLNLLAFSLIAFLVAIFLIYSSMSFSVTQRQQEIGILRALGASRTDVRNLFILEGGLYGLVGGALGIILGILIARATFSAVAQSITSLYLLIKVERLHLSWTIVVKGLFISVFISVVAAIWPAREAARISPRDTFHTKNLKTYNPVRKGRSFILGLSLLAIAVIFVFQKPIMGKPFLGFASAFCMILGFSFMIPPLTAVTNAMLKWFLKKRRWSESELSISYLGQSLNRTTVSMAALVAVLAMVIGVIIMVTSFRQTVEIWIDQYISGDIFVSPALLSTARDDAFLPEEVIKDLESDPDIQDIFFYRHLKFFYNGFPTVLTAGNLMVLNRHGQMMFKDGDSYQILKQASEGKGIIVTETFSEAHDLEKGDHVLLPTPSGKVFFPILGIFYDYRTDGGGIWMDRSVFIRYWKDQKIDTARLYLHDKSLLADVQERIKKTYSSRYQLFALSHGDLKKRVLDIFDQTFTITYVLEFIALVAATIGIANTFLVLIMDRKRDIGVYRAIGATRGNVIRLITSESGLMGLISYVLGATGGTILSLILIFVINKQSFGWTIRPLFSPGIYLMVLFLVLGIAVSASLIPAIIAARKKITEAVRVE